MFLVTGATGKTGGQTIKQLLAKGASVRAFVRNEEKAAPLKEQGVELVVGDIGDADAVAKAMDGVDGVLLTLPNGPNQLDWELGVLKQAEAAGVKHLVYMSSTESNADNPRRIPQVHWKVVEAIMASNVNWTIMRPNFFMQGIFPFAGQVKANDAFAFPAGDGTASMCDVRDVGEVAAVILTGGESHYGKTYDLTGPDIVSFHDVAALLSKTLGREITYNPMPLQAFHDYLAKVLKSDWHVDGVVELMQEMSEEGGLDFTTETMGELLRRPPTTIAQFIEEHKAMFG
ncbi:MAG: NAD(P)H-binding protein [Alphaproteobacteria bacterium]|nr:NAD(P)H-binding protein [Alphaproteobacteria bacterium]